MNNDSKGFKCPECNQELIGEFNFCPKCGSENIVKQYKVAAPSSIDLNKGFITPDELEYIKFVTPEEVILLQNEEKTIEEVGIPVTEENCPFEIRSEILYKNINLKNDIERRKKVYNDHINFYNSQETNFKLSTFNKRITITNKKFPITSKIEQPIQVIHREPLKREFIPKPKRQQNTSHQTKTVKTEHKPKTQIKRAGINIEYGGVLYLLDVIKHPKTSKLPDSILSSLDISSNAKIINYLRKNNLLINAEGLDKIRINLQQKKVSDLKKILSNNKLEVSGSKDDLINRICENLSDEELTKYSKGKVLQVTNEGKRFINEHPQVEIYVYNLKNYSINDFENFYQENRGLTPLGLTLSFLEKVRNEFAEQLLWNKYSTTYQIENKVYKEVGDIQKELESCINLFICSLNPWIDNKISLKYSTPITQNLQKEIIKLNNNMNFENINIHDLFIEQTKKILLPGLFIEPDEMFNIFIRISKEETLENINKELESKFDTTELKPKDTKFTSKAEQKEIYNKVKGFFR